MKTSFILAALCCVALLASGAAMPLFSSSNITTTPPTVTTNVCGMDWYYCPRDPGCVTYDMSVHDVKIHVDGIEGNIDIVDLKPGHTAQVQITGITTITSVSASASYRVYALDGKNMAFGVLANAFILTGNGGFVFTPSFEITADAIGSNGFVEFGIDVFQEKSGTDEGMCVQLASKPYVEYVESRPSPPFQMQCRDLGNGHFIPDVHRIVPTPIASPSCGTQACDLEYYCKIPLPPHTDVWLVVWLVVWLFYGHLKLKTYCMKDLHSCLFPVVSLHTQTALVTLDASPTP